MRLLVAALCLVCLTPAAAPGEAPNVLADIPPVHSLVAQVLGDAGSAHLLLEGGDPHGASLRPSQAARLQDADLVVWIGPELSPQLAESLAALRGEDGELRLLSVPGTRLLSARDEIGHGYGSVDPHAWLDPENAALWLDAIAEAVAARDPGHAASYRRNAEAAKARLAAREPVSPGTEPTQIAAAHDSWQYAEAALGFRTVTMVSAADASEPGPARLAAIRRLLLQGGADCLLAEPETPPSLLATLSESSEVPVVTADPLGRDLPPGSDLYIALLDRIADVIDSCT